MELRFKLQLCRMLNKTLTELDAITTLKELRIWHAYFNVLEKEKKLEELTQKAQQNLVDQNKKHCKF